MPGAQARTAQKPPTVRWGRKNHQNIIRGLSADYPRIRGANATATALATAAAAAAAKMLKNVILVHRFLLVKLYGCRRMSCDLIGFHMMSIICYLRISKGVL